MKPAGSPSPRFKKAWSPASRDPRFSRGTVDGLLARINPGLAAPWEPAFGSSWVAYMIGTKARKLDVYSPRRKELLKDLADIAVRAEAKAAAAQPKDILISAAAPEAVRAQETVTLRPRQRSVLGP